MPPSTSLPGDTLAEEDLRALQAEHEALAHDKQVTFQRQVSFAGQRFAVTGVALVPMLRYAGQRKDETGQVQMASMHRILEECLGDFRAFQNAAIETKAGLDDIVAVVQQVIEIHCARPWRAALRLLGYAATNLAELDGNLLLTTGRGMDSLTPRQLCNLAFASLIQGRDEEQRQEFLEDLYLDFDPENEARRKVMEMIASQGGGDAP